MSDTKQTRRAFIEKTLKMTAGAYVGMAVLDNFVGPKIGANGMPLNAATTNSIAPGQPNDRNPHPRPGDGGRPRDGYHGGGRGDRGGRPDGENRRGYRGPRD